MDLYERVWRIAGRGLSRFSTDSDLALVRAQLVCVLLVGGDVARHAEAPGDPVQEQRTSPGRQLYVVVVHAVVVYLSTRCAVVTLKRGYTEFKYYADATHSDLTPPG